MFFYWRTKDKKEIDFILKIKNKILPIETKLNFDRFNSTAIKYFNKKYKLKNYKVIGLEGDLQNNFYFYTWNA